MDTKHCIVCDTVKPVTEFFKARARKGGLYWCCRACFEIRRADYKRRKALGQVGKPCVPNGPRLRDIKHRVEIGQRIGRGVVTDPEVRIDLPARERGRGSERGARLLCDCGNIYETTLACLLTKKNGTKSCGCLASEHAEMFRSGTLAPEQAEYARELFAEGINVVSIARELGVATPLICRAIDPTRSN